MNRKLSWAPMATAIFIPIFYLVFYTPYGMDTTDFGYFYGYAWRITQGQMPYRDFFYIKPALPLYWHALWMSLTPEKWQILAGKAGFLMEVLSASWLAALCMARLFNLKKMSLPVSLLATSGFIFSIHTFPHMPWHTADGALFCAFSLWGAVYGWPLLSGITAAAAVLCKQSFALMPAGILFLLWFLNRTACLKFIAGFATALLAFFGWIWSQGGWSNFMTMTTGQLDIAEAIDAGILIYLRQNWLLPFLAVIPWLFYKFILKRRCPAWLCPAWCYLAVLTVWYLAKVNLEKTWQGFGLSWPTLFMVLGAVCIFLPSFFLLPYARERNSKHPLLFAGAALGVPLLASWSCAISGGYKIPALFSVPLLFAFFLFHAGFRKEAGKLAWGSIAAGLIMFGGGWQYPYVFPVRELKKADLTYEAGDIYPKASGVKIDRIMYEKLAELKKLRAKYGANYKTLPGFTLSYYLNGDRPQISSDWLIDWEINGKVNQLYDELLEKDTTVFMERDQLNAEKADSYERSGYGVPNLVRKNWKIVEETPHFLVFQKPS